ncbi:hypothetical protein WR25_11173 [Diploscapter pachys]|uniref:Iron-binding zinc finger CDGSH type domain-containing protein n=1 Tax=Diploscapter pachys TaxID=2018661 RepID=A0A2A2LK97_9BILA|nr:hypothetical protein WR25_11173 [Diploscapter pachys]
MQCRDKWERGEIEGGMKREQKSEEKKTAALVKDIVFKDEVGEKKSFCRCWLSEKWPYCDGSHSKWNKLTGDNLGPVVVRERDMKVNI